MKFFKSFKTNIASLVLGTALTSAAMAATFVPYYDFNPLTGQTGLQGQFNDLSLNKPVITAAGQTISAQVGGANAGSFVVSGTAPSSGILLGTAVTYGVIATSTITNTGTTTITGNLALFPGTSVTGSPTVTGTSNITNSAAAQAVTDATTAFNTGNALPGATVLSASSYELAGTTLSPGLYKIGSSADISVGGTVTLNGGGNPNAVFIFQIGSTFTANTSSTVSLTNGAQAQNVYWLVGSSATINASSVVNGTVIAAISDSLGNGASVTGHVFALNGAVTLIGNTVTATGSTAVGALLFTYPVAVLNGFVCTFKDLTTSANTLKESAYTTTLVSIVGTPTSGDLITYKCTAF